MSDRPYLVSRTDTFAGLSVRASSPEEAVEKAQRWRWMRGAPSYKVRLAFHGPDDDPYVVLPPPGAPGLILRPVWDTFEKIAFYRAAVLAEHAKGNLSDEDKARAIGNLDEATALLRLRQSKERSDR